MNTETKRLERSIRWLQAYSVILTLALAALLIAVSIGGHGVLRVRGIVIEDDAGRERILLGAPIPEAASRVRTDTARVRELWAPAYPDPDQYMGYYSEYDHTTNGLLILDENGFDRLAIGDPVPDPNIGRRLGPSSGMVINDAEGFERSGFGLAQVDGRYRVVYGLDSDRAIEGLTLALFDGGKVGVTVRDGDWRIFLGSAPPGDAATGLAEAFQGLLVRRGDEVIYEINAQRNQ